MVKRYVRQSVELPIEVVRQQREYATRVSRSMAVLAIDAIDKGVSLSQTVVPRGFNELVNRVIPGGDAEQIYERAMAGARHYIEVHLGDNRSPLERITQSVERIEFASGDSAVLRAPAPSDAESLQELYRSLPDNDRRTRFFAMVTPEMAAKDGLRCSSLVQPHDAHDYVLVNDISEVIGHAGYVGTDDGVASLHIVLRPDARAHTVTGERVSNLLFEKAITTAYLDENVSTIVAETLFDNTGINKLVTRILATHDGFCKSFDYGYIENTIPAVASHN